MQANLLDGPLPYLDRDEIKHYLRAYFNGFASAFYPGDPHVQRALACPSWAIRPAITSRPPTRPSLTYWLRLMFVHEQGNDLYLGQAIPRYWLAPGKSVGIERAATHFGPLSLRVSSHAGQLKAVLTPPTRNPPETIYLRLRHPQGKPLKTVTVNGKPYERFDPEKEWVVLPGNVSGVQEIVGSY